MLRKMLNQVSYLSGISVLRSLGLVLLIAIFASACPRSLAQTRTTLSNATALYARVIRLSHNADATKNGSLVASVVAFQGGVGEIDVYGSSNGANFEQIGVIHDPDFSGGLCCGTLFELPRAEGAMPAGTLLWAGSIGQTSTSQPMQVKVYQSADRGATWAYLSNCATAPGVHSAAGGLWEPQFDVASDGALVCFWSDETQAGHSQLIRQSRSYDGINWKDATNTVASNVATDRPGMPVVTQLPGGTYLMSYEICGTQACKAFTRTSVDGWNWGDPTSYGNLVVTSAGQWLEHAPYSTWAPSAASANGTLLLVGQMMYDSNGSVSAGNGITIFTNHSLDGTGPWGTMPAPVQVPTAYNNYCPNYSSPLLPSVDGSTVLEFASDYVGGVCTMFYGTGPIQAGTATPTVTVTPSSTSVTSYPLTVTITASGAGSLPIPTGNVTLAIGSYSATQALVNGAVTFTIVGPLTAGTNTLAVTYAGDSNYTSATGSATVSVVAAGITITANALSVKAGATSSNSTTITVAPTRGFTGSVSLAASILSSPVGGNAPPTFTFSPSNASAITNANPVTASLTVHTSATTSALLNKPASPFKHGQPMAPIASATLMLFFGLARRRWFAHNLRNRCELIAAIGILLFGLAGCGSGTESANIVQGTTPGTYLVQVAGVSGSVTATTQFSLTVE